MALHNLGKDHLDAATMQALIALVSDLEQTLDGKVTDLSPEDRQTYGSIGEQNKLLVNKVADYRHNQPQHSAPEVDWAEFEADYASRKFWENLILRLATIIRQAESTKILHDHDNYQDALTDYAYSQYRAERNIPGAADKVTELKQFFNRTGSSKKEDKTPPIEPPVA